MINGDNNDNSSQKKEYYKVLRQEVWRKAIGSNTIEKKSRYYEQIKNKINQDTGFLLNKDTIRNFLEGKHTPQVKTLDIYSTYVLGGNTDSLKTFQDFQNWYHGKSIFRKLREATSINRKEFQITIVILLTIITLISLVIYRQPNTPNKTKISSSTRATFSPQLEALTNTSPSKEVFVSILADFPFNDKRYTSISEAQKIMEWLGISEITFYTDDIESSMVGGLDNNCEIILSYKNNDNLYELRCICKDFTPSQPIKIELRKPRKTQSIYAKLNTNDLLKLEEEGWYLRNPDLSKWVTQNKTGRLILKTHLGDSWLENEDYEPIVYNILSRKMECGDCCKIVLTISGFNPTQRYQQGGFFLFYDDLDFPSLRMTYRGDENITSVQAAFRDDKYSNEDIIHISKYAQRTIVSKVINGIAENPVDSIKLILKIQGNTYFFSKQTDDNKIIPIASQKILMPSPVSIGLAAFQGRPEIPFPIRPVADILPVYFESLKIISCD